MVNSMATVKIGFVSLGCPKNLVDSQNIITLLLKSGYDVSNTYENADAVVINTCGFIESSVEESMNVINEALGSCKNVVVTGCLGPRKDFILEHYPEPKPAYTTIATFLKILTQKGFVEHKKGTGKLLIYTPLITKEKYRRQVMEEVKDDFFGNSFKSMFSFFVKEEHISADDIKELLKLMEEDAL